MSQNISSNAFESLDSRSPKEDQSIGSGPPLSGPNSEHSSTRARRSRRGGKKTGSNAKSPSPDTDSTGELPLRVATVSLGPPIVNPESSDDGESDVPPEERPDPASRSLDVKAQRDMRKIEEMLFASAGKPLPEYVEELELTDKELHATDVQQGMRDYTSRYYRSGDRLSKKDIAPLFVAPTHLLANSQSFELVVQTVFGRTRLQSFGVPEKKVDLTENSYKAVLAEVTLRHFTALDKDDPDRKRYFENLRALEFMRSTWDALLLSYQVIQCMSFERHRRGLGLKWMMPSAMRRQVNRLRIRLLAEPYATAKELKRLSGVCRSWFFGGPRPTLPLIAFQSKYDALMFSYIGRALPSATWTPVREGLGQLIERLTSTPPPVVRAWGDFCVDYLSFYKPKGDTPSRPTDASAGACFGYTRQAGGFTRAVQDMVALGIAYNQVEPKDNDYFGCEGQEDGMYNIMIDLRVGSVTDLHAFDSNFWIDPDRDEDGNLQVRKDWELEHLNHEARLGEFYRRSVWRAVDEVHAQLDGCIPFVALGAPEPGLKVRYPTMAYVAVLLVSQVLRRAADSHLKMDSRCSQSLGGGPEIRLGRCKGPWYSQDLTAATDLHPFWLQRQFYTTVIDLNPDLEKLRKWLPLLFGPRKLIDMALYKSDEMPLVPDNPLLPYLRREWGKVYEDLLRVGAGRTRTVGILSAQNGFDVSEEDMSMLIFEWSEYFQAVNELTGTTTTTGNPMGEAASFPLLPMVTVFGCERAGLPQVGTTGDDARIPLGQKGQLRVRLELPQDRSRKMNKILESINGIPDAEVGWRARKEILEQSLAECGAVLSRGDEKQGKPNKIFLHPRYSLYKEIPMMGDRALPFLPIKLLNAPPGGAKGTVSWFNQPTAVRQHCEEFQFHFPRSLWKALPYWNETVAAFSRGLPVAEPVTFGGINHPVFPHTAGINPYRTQAWLSTLTQLTISEWASGTGLSPLPPAKSSAERRAAKVWLDDVLTRSALARESGASKGEVTLLPFHPEGQGTLPTLKEAAEIACQASSSYLLYARGPVEFTKTPSIIGISRKFDRSVTRGRTLLTRKRKAGSPLHLTYAATKADIIRKQQVYLIDPDASIPERTAARSYGLYRSQFDPDRARWRWDWLERGLSSDDFIRAFFPTEGGAYTNPPGPTEPLEADRGLW